MKQHVAPVKIAAVTIIAFAAVAATIWLFIAVGSHSRESMLQTKFKHLQGYDGDPAIQSFRDNGQAAVAFLAQKMQSKDPAVRVRAVGALRQMGYQFSGSSAGVTALCDALNQSDTEERSIAEGALGDVGPPAKAAVPTLIKCVSEGTDINGIWALGRIGPDANAALPILESKMREGTGRERVYAAGAVWEISGTNTEAKTIVIEASQSPDRQIRNAAHNVLVECPEINP